MKNQKRRRFLQNAGMLTAGAMIAPLWSCKQASKDFKEGYEDGKAAAESALSTTTGDIDKFGIQLYSLRDVITADPKATLKTLTTYGYGQIEGYETDKNTIWWNMPHMDFKKYLDDIGLDMVSSHCNIHENFEEKAAQAAEVGLKYLICPYIGAQKSMEDWKKVTDQFNACGDICAKNGIRFAYHNHAYSFQAFSGQIPQDFMMENTNPETVDHEMDIYWVVTGGADPVEYLKKYPNRFRLCHVKDRMANTDDRMASCTLGTGIIDFPSILKEAEAQGMEYFFVEQERYDGTTPMDAAKDGAKYLSEVKFA